MQGFSKGITPNTMRTLKFALFALTLLALLPSCVTQRKCLLKFPPPPADTVTFTDTQWRDTIIYRTLPADTIRDSVEVVLPCPVPPTFKSDTVRAVRPLASAAAWLHGNKLQLRLTLNETTLAFKLDSAIKASAKTTVVTQQIIVEKKVIPPFYRASLFVNLFLIVFVAAIFYIALRRKP